MPIQFRCTRCNQKLAITRRKAGKVVKCPACSTDVPVPTLAEAAATGQLVGALQPEAEEDLTPPPRSAQDSPQPTAVEDEFSPAGLPADELEPAPVGAAVAGERVFETPLPSALQEGYLESLPGAQLREEETDEDDDEGFHLHRRPADESGLDMTPMVDVTFLLLIFFMITASFSLQKSMETEPPEPDQEGAAQLPSMDDLADDSVIVEIDESDAIFVDETPVGSIAELVDVLSRKVSSEQKLEMVIEPHPLSRHGTVVQAIDAGIEVGMQRIRRVTRKGE